MDMALRRAALVLMTSLAAVACTRAAPKAGPGGAGEVKESPMKLSSSAFEEGSPIPKIHTCEGEDQSPPLAWEGVPEGTQSFVLTCFDPDAPRPEGWVHWALYDLPPDLRALPQGASIPQGAKSLANDFGVPGYRGPCPPPGHGVHHYEFTLYALDVPSLSEKPVDYPALVTAARKHALAKAVLVGTYQR